MAEKLKWKEVFQGGTKYLWRSHGRSVWERLGPEILSPLEKTIVSADPDLRESSLQKMIEFRGGPEKLQTLNFFFEEINDKATSDAEIQDVGFATLSYCIKQDRNANWAEIIGRYAMIRRLPFLEVALYLKQLEKQGKLFYFDDNTSEPIRWTPKVANPQIVNLESEWDILETICHPREYD